MLRGWLGLGLGLGLGSLHLSQMCHIWGWLCPQMSPEQPRLTHADQLESLGRILPRTVQLVELFCCPWRVAQLPIDHCLVFCGQFLGDHRLHGLPHLGGSVVCHPELLTQCPHSLCMSLDDSARGEEKEHSLVLGISVQKWSYQLVVPLECGLPLGREDQQGRPLGGCLVIVHPYDGDIPLPLPVPPLPHPHVGHCSWPLCTGHH